MNVINRVYLLIFCQVVAPVIVVFGLMINLVILDPQALPGSLGQSLEWFQQNPSVSSNIVSALYTTAGAMAVIMVVLAISLARSKKGGEDTKVGRQIRRMAR